MSDLNTEKITEYQAFSGEWLTCSIRFVTRLQNSSSSTVQYSTVQVQNSKVQVQGYKVVLNKQSWRLKSWLDTTWATKTKQTQSQATRRVKFYWKWFKTSDEINRNLWHWSSIEFHDSWISPLWLLVLQMQWFFWGSEFWFSCSPVFTLHS